MSEQAATVKVSVKPETRDKFHAIRAELVLMGECALKFHEVLDRAAQHYLEEIRKQKAKRREAA